jgi:hypothetical protein
MTHEYTVAATSDRVRRSAGIVKSNRDLKVVENFDC